MIMDIEVNKPEPIASGNKVEFFKRGTNVKKTIEDLEAGIPIVISEFYNNGLSLLRDIQKHLDNKYSNESFDQQRAYEAAYFKLSNLLLIEVVNHKLTVEMAPVIGWFKTFYF